MGAQNPPSAYLFGGTNGFGSLLAPLGSSSGYLTTDSSGNINIASGTQGGVNNWVAYTPTLVGFGTATSVAFSSRRVGDSLEVQGYLTAGTTTAVPGTFSIGFNGTDSNVTIDNTKLPGGSSHASLVGTAGFSASGATSYYVIAQTSATTALTLSVQSASAAVLTPANASAILSTGQSMSVYAKVPITGWTATNAALSSQNTYRSVTVTDTCTTADNILVLSGASFTETLYTAVGNSGATLLLVHAGTVGQAYTLNTTSAQTIGGVASGSYILQTIGERLRLVSNGVNWIILDHNTVTPWTTYTPTFGAGWGTVAVSSFTSRRVGSMLEVAGTFTLGTTAASAATITVGYGGTSANVTIDTAQNPGSAICGIMTNSGSSATYFGAYVLMPASNLTTVNVGVQTSSLSGGAVVVGTGFVSSTTAQCRFSVPIVGWQP